MRRPCKALYLLQKHPDGLTENTRMFYIKTPGCFQQEHGDVFTIKPLNYLWLKAITLLPESVLLIIR